MASGGDILNCKVGIAGLLEPQLFAPLERKFPSPTRNVSLKDYIAR